MSASPRQGESTGRVCITEGGDPNPLLAYRTLQLELKYLSEITGNPIYWQKAEKVSLSDELASLLAAEPFLSAGHRYHPRAAQQGWTCTYLYVVRWLCSFSASRRLSADLSASSPDTGSFVMSDIRLGSRADSYYEYLSKM